jgi:RNA polymerase sigma-70 factor, ECF subfamily
MNQDLQTIPLPTSPSGGAPALQERAMILSRLRERIVAFAASHSAGAHAEDLAQEVMLLLHEKYGQVDRMEDLVPLAFQILRFKLAAHRRRTARRGEYDAVDVDAFPPPSGEPDPATVLERKELLAKLMGGIARMGERCRELFRLKLQGRSYIEIQGLMGAASLNTVYTWDYRCRKQLLESLGGGWEAVGRTGVP